MARLARVVAPGFPHHITQRGNRRQQTFFCDEDYQYYVELMGQWCGAHDVEILAYCLMPNHVHLIAVPQSADGLKRAIGEAHRRYTRMVNVREGWRGHLWLREEDIKLLRAHERTGRPLGGEEFLASLEENLGRILIRKKPGPKGKPGNSVWCPRNPGMVSPEPGTRYGVLAPRSSGKENHLTM